jgi:hypothetical protein
VSSQHPAAIWPLPAAIVLCAAVLAIQLDQAQPPMPLGADAPATQFSAERARSELTRLLGDESPHPVGSPANRAVKERLIARLQDLGLEVDEQRAVGCGAHRAVCAPVENVVVDVPGERPDAIALLAHYDSVPPGPGAGDDGAGVATLVEVARTIALGAPYRNSVLFVFTDAEEVGLLGAEAFFAGHPDAKRVRTVINLEGAGSAGPVRLFRTGAESGHVLTAFAATATMPIAQSLTEEVFKRMPNDTDFSVALRAGLPGVDFAFVHERNHYHTPLDSIAELDLGTLQHHGENTLPLLRVLLDADLAATASTGAYTSLGARLWLRWSPSTGVALAVAALALLAFATWRSCPRLLHVAGAAGGALAIAIVSVLICLAALWLVDRIVGVRPNWPADPWPWRIAVFASPALALALVGPACVRRIGPSAAFLGAWWLWSLLALACAVWLPLAANQFVPAALVAAALAALLAISPRGAASVGVGVAACAAAVAAGWFFLPMAPMLEASQGLELAAAAVGPLALMAAAMLPAAMHDPGRIVLLGALGALLLAFAMAVLVSPYSVKRPQHLNLVTAQEDGAATGRLVAVTNERVPDSLRALGDFQRVHAALPWTDEDTHALDVAREPDSAPAVEPLDPADGFTRFRITPPPGADAVALLIPRARIADAVRIDERDLTTQPTRGNATHRRIAYFAPPAAGFVVGVKPAAGATETAYLMSVQNGLSDVAIPFAEARGALAVPVHSGDQTIVYRKIEI